MKYQISSSSSSNRYNWPDHSNLVRRHIVSVVQCLTCRIALLSSRCAQVILLTMIWWPLPKQSSRVPAARLELSQGASADFQLSQFTTTKRSSSRMSRITTRPFKVEYSSSTQWARPQPKYSNRRTLHSRWLRCQFHTRPSVSWRFKTQPLRVQEAALHTSTQTMPLALSKSPVSWTDLIRGLRRKLSTLYRRSPRAIKRNFTTTYSRWMILDRISRSKTRTSITRITRRLTIMRRNSIHTPWLGGISTMG